ncbi:MAG: response regulator transcription factor [Myxococcales bacterium]|nr:response regulator transcription factor [Myxococcales bacterium]
MTHRILLVDDDAGVLGTTGRVLERAGYDVEGARSVAEARHLLESERFDLLITDIHMPGEDGIALLRTREEHRPKVPVIVITGQPSVGTAVEALRHAAIDYLVKPLNPEELIERAGIAVEKGRARRVVTDAQERAGEISKLLGALQAVLDEPGASVSTLDALQSHGGASRDPMSNLSPSERSQLSRREREVVQRLADGLSTSEAAKALFVSPHTLRNHLKSIYRKLGVHSRVELMRKVLGA